MEKEILLKSFFEKRKNIDTSSLTTEELLEILESKKDIINKPTLAAFVNQILSFEYKLFITQYAKSVKDKFDKVKQLIQEFEACHDNALKYDIYKQIVEMLKTEEVILSLNGELPNELVEVIEYGFQIQDVHSVALLMKKRKEILDYTYGYELKQEQTWKRLNSQVLYKEYVKMIAEQCDDATASQYLEELIKGKCLMLQYESERFGWRISKKDIADTYKSFKTMKEKRSKVNTISSVTESSATEADE